MENYFRFLINVDQCLNMASFDMFFYKLKSDRLFSHSEIRLRRDSAETSLGDAAHLVRDCLDKYPFRVTNFEVVLAMRRVCGGDSGRESWRNSILYLLLHLCHELRELNVRFGAYAPIAGKGERALTVIVYDADAASSAAVSSYLKDVDPKDTKRKNTRLHKDLVAMLSEELGIGGEDRHDGVPYYGTGASFASRLRETLAERGEMDIAVRSVLEMFVKEYFEDTPSDGDGATAGANALYLLAGFLTDKIFDGCSVHNVPIDTSDRRAGILAQFCLTEYLDRGRWDGEKRLSEYCDARFSEVWFGSKTELLSRYAGMLKRYRKRLNAVQPIEKARSLPILPDRRELMGEEIVSDSHPEFDDEGKRDDPEIKAAEKEERMQKLLSEFRSSVKRDPFGAMDEWNRLYAELSDCVANLEKRLEEYASEMSGKYIARLTERKKDPFWRKEYQKENIEKATQEATEEQTRLRGKLKDPKINPSLSLSDEMNFLHELEIYNQSVSHTARCLKAVKSAPFWGLLVGLAGFSALHHILMQNYIFDDLSSILVFLLYTAATVCLMWSCRALPRRFFLKKLLSQTEELKESQKQYLYLYYDKGRSFGEYFRLLDRLDLVQRYLSLLERIRRAAECSARRADRFNEQLETHKKKLDSFRELTDAFDTDDAADDGLDTEDSTYDKSGDVLSNPFFWPQGR